MNNEVVNVLHYVAIMNRGGQETLIMNLNRNIDHSKVKFSFLCTVNTKGDFDDEIKQKGGDIYYLNKKKRYPIIDPLNRAWVLYKLLKTHSANFDVFHIHTQHAMDAFLSASAAVLAGIKKVAVHSHNSNTLYHPFFHSLFKPFLIFLPIKKFACSKMAGKWMFGDSEYQVINNGIDVNKFKYDSQVREKIRERMNWKGKIIIGHVGRFNDQKNHGFLIDIFSELIKTYDNAYLVLIGDGENKDRMKKKVSRLDIGDKVFFLGVREDVNMLYQAMDLFLFPSKFEGLPVVLVEVQANGLYSLISNNITSEIDITTCIQRMDLRLDSKEWAKKISCLIRNGLEHKTTDDLIINSGYDIRNVANNITKYYLQK